MSHKSTIQIRKELCIYVTRAHTRLTSYMQGSFDAYRALLTYIGLFWHVHRALLTYAQKLFWRIQGSFDIFTGLFWHIHKAVFWREKYVFPVYFPSIKRAINSVKRAINSVKRAINCSLFRHKEPLSKDCVFWTHSHIQNTFTYTEHIHIYTLQRVACVYITRPLLWPPSCENLWLFWQNYGSFEDPYP